MQNLNVNMYQNLDNEKNFIFYDDTYLGPGYIILTKKNNNIVKFFKIYIMNNNGFPNYGIRAYKMNSIDKPDEEFRTIKFSFSNLEDNEKNLYNIFKDLDYELKGECVKSIDSYFQGQNHFNLISYGNFITINISKDVYGVKFPTDFIDINIGDNDSCMYYEAINRLYNKLSNLEVSKNEDIGSLLLKKD